jgi:hypothetical protein
MKLRTISRGKIDKKKACYGKISSFERRGKRGGMILH